jgi:hypothetical protein
MLPACLPSEATPARRGRLATASPSCGGEDASVTSSAALKNLRAPQKSHAWQYKKPRSLRVGIAAVMALANVTVFEHRVLFRFLTNLAAAGRSIGFD